MRIRDILKAKGRHVVTVGPEETVAATARRIAESGKGLAVVCDADDKPLGIVSVIDINRAVARHEARAPAMPVRELMTTEIVICAPGDSVEDALEKMTGHNIRHLPVIENGVLLGLVNMQDLLHSRFEDVRMTAEEMRRYFFGTGYH